MKFKKINESSNDFEFKVEQAIPVDAKDGFVGCKYSSTDNACLVVFAPGSTNDIKVAKKSLLKMGWSVEEEKIQGIFGSCCKGIEVKIK